MPIQLTFTLTFDSDWHINAGFGSGSLADAKIERDSDGVPIVSGSSLKGLFRDALFDLQSQMSSDTYQNVPAADVGDQLLGSPGHESRWTFGHARPQSHLELSGQKISETDMATVITGVAVDARTRRAEENKFYTRELGMAQAFTFTVTATPDAEIEQDAMWLVAAASYIRRLGGRRRRGTGKCHIQLSDNTLHNGLLAQFASHFCGIGQAADVTLENTDTGRASAKDIATKRFRIWIYSQRPIVISSTPEAGNNYAGRQDIPGRTIRGALAWKVASTDRNTQAFRDLFVLGGARFSNLIPTTYDAKPIAASPMGLQKVSKEPYVSVMLKPPDEKGKGYTKKHILREGYPVVEKEDSSRLRNKTHMHVRINPQTKRANDGDLYSYEAPDSGVLYVGEIELTQQAWKDFADLLAINLNQAFSLRIGKARRRSYGLSKVYIEELKSDDAVKSWMPVPFETRWQAPSTTDDNKFILTLASDTIALDTWGRFRQGFDREWLAELLGEDLVVYDPHKDEEEPAQFDLEVMQRVVKNKLVQGFNMRDGLPQWRDIALIAGSSVTIRINNLAIKDKVKVALQKLERDSIGLRRDEGFGRLIVNHPAHTGEHHGFSKLDIPDGLLPSETGQAPSDYKPSEKDVPRLAERVATALARQLVQVSQSLDDALAVLDSFGDSPEQTSGDKNEVITKEHKAQVQSLLQALKVQPPRIQRRSIILIAEAILRYKKD